MEHWSKLKRRYISMGNLLKTSVFEVAGSVAPGVSMGRPRKLVLPVKWIHESSRREWKSTNKHTSTATDPRFLL
jgi:hypothetical protein